MGCLDHDYVVDMKSLLIHKSDHHHLKIQLSSGRSRQNGGFRYIMAHNNAPQNSLDCWPDSQKGKSLTSETSMHNHAHCWSKSKNSMAPQTPLQIIIMLMIVPSTGSYFLNVDSVGTNSLPIRGCKVDKRLAVAIMGWMGEGRKFSPFSIENGM